MNWRKNMAHWLRKERLPPRVEILVFLSLNGREAIKIRLTDSEHQRLIDRCDRTHLAEWLRQLGLGEHIARKRRLPDVAPELLRQVSGIGNNLNQIARRLNQLDGLNPTERVSLLAVLNSLDRNLGELLEQHRDR